MAILETFTINQGDRRKYIFATLAPLDARGKVNETADRDLTDAEDVTFTMRRKDTNAIVLANRPVEIDDLATAEVHYEWAAGETDTPGKYWGKFEVNWGAGVIETYPNNKKGFLIIITAD